MQDNNKELKTKLNNIEDTLDIMMFGQPDIKSARITNTIQKRKGKRVNHAK